MFGWGIPSITTDELADKIAAGKVSIIDVREPSEFASGHVPKAVNIPLGRITDKVGKFDPHAETFVICQSGNRSASAVRRLTKLGFDNVYNVKGGTSAWRGKLFR